MASTISARIKSNRIESDRILSSEKSLCHRCCTYATYLVVLTVMLTFPFFSTNCPHFLCAMQWFSRKQPTREKNILIARIKYMQNWSQHGHICTMVVVHIVRIGHVAHFCRSGRTCFGFSFAFAFFIHSFFSLLSVKPISSLHVAVSWHGMAWHGMAT